MSDAKYLQGAADTIGQPPTVSPSTPKQSIPGLSCRCLVERLNTAGTVPLLKMVTDLIPVILFVIDTSGVFLLSEGKSLKGMGLKPGEVVGTSVFDLYADYPVLISAIRRMLSGELLTEECALMGRFYEVHFIPLRSPDGLVCGGAGIFLEITRRRCAEQQLNEQHNVFESIFAALPTALILASPDRVITRVNPAAAEMFGYETGEFCGKSTGILYSDHEQFKEAGIRNAASTEKLDMELQCRKKDGSVFTTESTCCKLLNGDGEVQWLVGMHNDVTEQRQAQALLKWHEEMLEIMIDAAPTMAMIIDATGKILFINKRFAIHMRIPVKELLASHAP